MVFFADRAVARTVRRKDAIIATGLCALPLQDLDGEFGQGFHMFAAYLRALGGDRPGSRLKVKLFPMRQAEFARSRIEQGHQFKRGAC